jgi:hypothetical protein
MFKLLYWDLPMLAPKVLAKCMRTSLTWNPVSLSDEKH